MPVLWWARDSTDIRQLPGGFVARITPLTDLGQRQIARSAGKLRSKTAFDSTTHEARCFACTKMSRLAGHEDVNDAERLCPRPGNVLGGRHSHSGSHRVAP